MADNNDAAAKPTPKTKHEKAQAIVDAWKVDHLHNSLFAQDTAAWNHFNERLPALVDAIAKEV